jgi:hypothetical protein
LKRLELLVEELSAVAALHLILPKIVPDGTTYAIHPFQGTKDLLLRVGERLTGYSKWMPDNWRILILVDRDNDDCKKLKQALGKVAAAAGFESGAEPGRHLVRICIEELEA